MVIGLRPRLHHVLRRSDILRLDAEIITICLVFATEATLRYTLSAEAHDDLRGSVIWRVPRHRAEKLPVTPTQGENA